LSKGWGPLQATPPENVTGVTNLSTLINRTVTFAEISEIGELRITFYGGASLCVKPCGTYKSYTLVGGGEMIVCSGNGTIA
jgi:hypothetical protein